MNVLEFLKSLYYRARGVESVVGAERVAAVISHFQDDIVALGLGLDEMSDADEEIEEQQHELGKQRGELLASTNQAQKLLDGLNALLGV